MSYVTFKLYDKHGRRLSIFELSTRESTGVTQFAIFTCSRSDMFVKKKARKIFELWKEAYLKKQSEGVKQSIEIEGKTEIVNPTLISIDTSLNSKIDSVLKRVFYRMEEHVTISKLFTRGFGKNRVMRFIKPESIILLK